MRRQIPWRPPSAGKAASALLEDCKALNLGSCRKLRFYGTLKYVCFAKIKGIGKRIPDALCVACGSRMRGRRPNLPLWGRGTASAVEEALEKAA
jgi:hypothetical protein